jgi:hypothetical protein
MRVGSFRRVEQAHGGEDGALLMTHRQDAVGRGGLGHERARALERGGQRLLHIDVGARVQRRPGHLEMDHCGRGDGDRVHPLQERSPGR